MCVGGGGWVGVYWPACLGPWKHLIGHCVNQNIGLEESLVWLSKDPLMHFLIISSFYGSKLPTRWTLSPSCPPPHPQHTHRWVSPDIFHFSRIKIFLSWLSLCCTTTLSFPQQNLCVVDLREHLLWHVVLTICVLTVYNHFNHFKSQPRLPQLSMFQASNREGKANTGGWEKSTAIFLCRNQKENAKQILTWLWELVGGIRNLCLQNHFLG